MSALIEIRNATIWRGSTKVFENLNLTIEQHERVAILGPNGAGKTTLLKTLNRELYPVREAGADIRILGRSRWNVWELRRQIGIVSHDLHVRYTPNETALDVVQSGFRSSIGLRGSLRPSRNQRQAALDVLEELGISALRDTPLKAMSTGQQRRCLLGRALVHEPDCLILDEPTAGLDLAASFEYLGRIRRLAASGRSIVLVTHHLNEIPPEIERVVLLDSGHVVADGEKAAILRADTLSAVYRTPIRVREIDGYYVAWPGETEC